MLRTATVTGEPKTAGSALIGQTRQLFATKLLLTLCPNKLAHGRFGYVSQTILWVNEMVARVETAIMLDRHSIPALFGKHTKGCGMPHPQPKLHVKMLYKYFADVSGYPGVEYITEEFTVYARTDAPLCHGVARVFVYLRGTRQPVAI